MLRTQTACRIATRALKMCVAWQRLGSLSLARVSTTKSRTSTWTCRVLDWEHRVAPDWECGTAKLAVMQARAFPPCRPGNGPLPGLAGAAGRNDLIPVNLRRSAPAGRVRAVDGPSAAAAVADLPPAEVTWQIVVGAIAGVTPFVVAGVEFGKRIIAQKKCEVCGGSGLVMKKDLYVRCQGCGGFLPWQSWRRFFKG